MRIHVVGLGAVGSFVAFHLRRTLSPKHQVIALHRKSAGPIIHQNPNGKAIRLSIGGVTTVQDGILHHMYHTPHPFEPIRRVAPALSPVGQPRGDRSLRLERPWDFHGLQRVEGPLTSLIVTTKAHAVSSVIHALRDLITPDTTIVLLHNGMGVYEELIRGIFTDPTERPSFVLATNTHGLYRKDTLDVVHVGNGEIQLGVVPDPLGRNYEAALEQENLPELVDLNLDDIASLSKPESITPRYLNLRNTLSALTGANALGATWRPFYEVHTAMQRKLVVNAFVNPVSALLQCRNGDVLGSEHGRWVMNRLCDEAERLYEAAFNAEVAEQRRLHELHSSQDGSASQFIPPTFPFTLRKFALRQEVERVVQQTKQNYSSMFRDIKLGNPTEVNYINGYLLRLARKHKVNSLVNESLYHLVKMRSAIPLIGRDS